MNRIKPINAGVVIPALCTVSIHASRVRALLEHTFQVEYFSSAGMLGISN
jgi:hypothetical protein